MSLENIENLKFDSTKWSEPRLQFCSRTTFFVSGLTGFWTRCALQSGGCFLTILPIIRAYIYRYVYTRTYRRHSYHGISQSVSGIVRLNWRILRLNLNLHNSFSWKKNRKKNTQFFCTNKNLDSGITKSPRTQIRLLGTPRGFLRPRTTIFWGLDFKCLASKYLLLMIFWWSPHHTSKLFSKNRRRGISKSVSQPVYYTTHRYSHHSIDNCILMAHLLCT